MYVKGATGVTPYANWNLIYSLCRIIPIQQTFLYTSAGEIAAALGANWRSRGNAKRAHVATATADTFIVAMHYYYSCLPEPRSI